MAINGKYQSVNVFDKNKLKNLDITNETAINEVMAMINMSANRAQKKKLQKTLNKVETIQAKCEKAANERAYRNLEMKADKNFMYVFACVGLTLIEDYHWKEDPDQDHGQISSFYERLTKKMDKWAEAGYSTEDLLQLLDEKTGIQLFSTFGG